jgi:transketolase
MKLEPLAFKWEAFGWDVKIVDGHSFEDMLPLFRGLRARNSDKPLAVIAKTIKGKGVSFMENKIIWHFRIPTGEEIAQARKELSI